MGHPKSANKGCYSKSNLADQTPKATSSSMTVGFCTQVCLAVSQSFHGVEGETDFKCTMCDNEYDQKVLLNQHIDSMHKGLKCSCKFCDQKFTTWYFLFDHLSKDGIVKKEFFMLFWCWCEFYIHNPQNYPRVTNWLQ